MPMRAWVFVLLLSACGPIAYVNDVTRSASDAVDEARAAEADKYAPYYWTRAVQYLEEARVIAAHADYQGANRFGRLATESAKKAVEEAAIAKKDPSKRPLELQQEVSPARSPSADPKADPKKAPAKDGGGSVAPAKEAP
jgi:uncharacterized protein DUF4398